MEWCQQCGVLNRPQPAMGVDEDGDPACSTHAVKRNDPEVQTNKTKLDAIRRPASVTQGPVAQPAKENVMGTVGRVFAPRACLCGCNRPFIPTGSTQQFAPGHKPKKAKSVKTAADLEIKAPKAEPLCGLVDLGKLKCDLLAKLAAVELVEKALAVELVEKALLEA